MYIWLFLQGTQSFVEKIKNLIFWKQEWKSCSKCLNFTKS